MSEPFSVTSTRSLSSPGSAPSTKQLLLLLGCACLVVGLAACGGEEPSEAPAAEAQAGPFQAEVGGALQATLEGKATARLDSAGRLAGVELDEAADTTQGGLSFELAARPPASRRTYTVGPQDEGGREDTTFSLMNAYLRLHGYEFAARAGSLRVRRDSTGLHGTFDLRLRGTVDAASDEAATVTASGRFDDVRAVRE
jgi:hypothetical protein